MQTDEYAEREEGLKVATSAPRWHCHGWLWLRKTKYRSVEAPGQRWRPLGSTLCHRSAHYCALLFKSNEPKAERRQEREGLERAGGVAEVRKVWQTICHKRDGGKRSTLTGFESISSLLVEKRGADVEEWLPLTATFSDSSCKLGWVWQGQEGATDWHTHGKTQGGWVTMAH